ncbi:phosphoglycerate mutase-like protein [Dentipellis sp. KUC8613]|nr:phosphoglycerate mutase-like protein [Dentipellis sp. KUC8613]
MLDKLCLLSVLPLLVVASPSPPRGASNFAGSTTSFAFPPPNVTVTIPDPNFPDATAVNFFGPTPTGDEAAAIATAPVLGQVDSAFPLSRPDTSDKKGSKFNVLRQWGNLSPMFSNDADAFGLPDASPLIPEGCGITQVHLVHRHGARYPTSGSAPSQLAAKLHNATAGAGFSASGPLEFLNTWTYKLGAEILTPFGREQLYNLGVGFRVRYGELLKGFDDLPVWRTTLQFAAGFFGVQSYQTSYHELIEIEADGFNSTLAPYDQCANANNNISALGGIMSSKWAAIYTVPTVKRLSKSIKGVNLTATDIIAMQQACAYETVALGFSSFCNLFTEEEWEQFEYFNDLSFWYGNGPGNPAVSAQGVGWAQELISRLTQTRITNFDTSVNGTVVSSNTTFPLNQPIFVDATHDTIISAIVTAMNFTSLSSSGPLPTDHIQKDRQWIVTHISPFASNMVGQVLSCPASDKPTHIRFVLNDAVVPLTGIKGCKADKNGLCELSSFISGLQQRISEIDYQFDCFANYTVPTPDNIVDGRFPPALRNATA